MDERVDDRGQLLDHELVADDGCHLLALFVVVDSLRLQADVLLFCAHVVKDYHFHVKTVVSLLYQPLLVFFVDSRLNLLDELFLNGLDMRFSLENDVYGLAMLLHLAVNCRLIQIRRDDIVFFLAVVLEQQFFLEFKCVVDAPECDSELLHFLVDAGDVVKIQDLEFHKLRFLDVLLDLWQHQQGNSFIDQFFLTLLLFNVGLFVIFHRYFVDLLHETDNQVA